MRQRNGRARARRDRDRAAHARVVAALRRAAGAGDRDAVRALVEPAATLWVDAAGSAAATPGVVEGADETARALSRILHPGPGVEVVVCSVNGLDGLVVRHDGVVTGVVSVAVRSERVSEAWVVLSPPKLERWNRD
ncbi:hypothetical protein [Cellulosimicrobium protaetiae]|uniref:Siderophore-interacting protein n=1 Tax=Cellulosimicrobium protaetiae TaxID=2587808 RepID=A0A6M5UGM7_9MICO|nr:hypothetical protein [Cellulosimicrobium protaetiae]QJW36762.1 hypothetical protein FIC82_011740 [Cellulosimicrobium protaetiae]